MRRVIHLNGVPQGLAGACILAYEKSMRSPAALIAVAVVCAACGCSGRVLSSDGSGEAEAGAPGADGAAPDDAVSPSGSDSGADSEGGAACSFPATGACNLVALQGPLVIPTVASGANLPQLSSGAIADGTYVLTAVTTYDVTASEADGSALSPAPAERATLVVAGGCIQWNDSVMGGSSSVSYSANAGQLMFEQECPAGLAPSWWATYAASTTTLVLAPVATVSPPTVYTYARQ